MILSHRWLKELVDLPVAADELSDVLTYLGMEVEDTHRFSVSLDKVVVGEILNCRPIEGTDHLFLTQTDVGGESLSIVCGAPNARPGLKVAVMLPGSKTADGRPIKKAKLRGFESHGMLASEIELGLSDESSGILEGDGGWETGASADKYLDLGDTLFDVELTPNRPDLFSHVGAARDIAAKFRLPLKWPEYPLSESKEGTASQVKVEIEAAEACPRYGARLVRGIRVASSPFALRLRLAHCGIRPISNIVDVTNYLMLGYGHPLHAFDLRFLEGSMIRVRYAVNGERFVTLDGQEQKLNSHDLLIADATKGVALAGVMGGLNSEIREDTTDVLIECAYFDPVHIRRTSKEHAISTESSRRFERGMDVESIPRVIDAAASMMHSLGAGQVLAGIIDAFPGRAKRSAVAFRPLRVREVIGLEIAESEMAETLRRLGCDLDPSTPKWQVTCPTWRPDLQREIDLIEEVIRIHGYGEIPAAEASRIPLFGHDDSLHLFRNRVQDVMVSMGFMETLSLSMHTLDPRRDPPDMPQGVELANPVTDDMTHLHGSLLPHLLQAAAANFQRGDKDLRLFETGRIFSIGSPDDPRTWEQQVVAAVLTGRSYPDGWGHISKPFDFYDLKGALELLSLKISLDKVEIFCYDIDSRGLLSGEVRSNGVSCGKWGLWPKDLMSERDIEADVGWFELDLSKILSCHNETVTYVELPRFPVAWRDLALLVDANATAGELLAVIRRAGGEYLWRVTPFDVFVNEKLGSGNKSVAIRLEFNHPDRSLQSKEVDDWVEGIVRLLESETGAVRRQ